MITCDLDNFMVQIKDGAVANIGAADKRSTVKLYDVEAIDVREFGDERVKLAFEDGEGNAVEIALVPDQAQHVRHGIEMLESGALFEDLETDQT